MALSLYCAGLILLCFVGYRLASQPTPQSSTRHQAAAPAILAGAKGISNPARKIFPLSVIHGGAYNPEELARARRSDPVVAAHYADFGTHPVFRKTSRDLLLYVSYRRGNQVYWSKTRHKVPQGETVIADGAALARARCGNRLSQSPQLPVAPTKEPGEEALNTPEAPDEPVSYNLAELPGPVGRPFLFSLPAVLGTPMAAGTASPATSVPYGTSAVGFPLGLGTGGSGPVLAGSRPAASSPSKTPQPSPVTAPTGVPGLPIAVGPGPGLPVSPGFPPIIRGAPLPPALGLVPEPSTLALATLAFLLAALAGRVLQSR